MAPKRRSSRGSGGGTPRGRGRGRGRGSGGRGTPSPAKKSPQKKVSTPPASVKETPQPDYTYDRETKILGISPMAFTDSIINAVNDFVADGVDAVEAALKQNEQLKTQHKAIEDSSDKLMLLMSKHVDLNFDKFELYVANNIFRLPEGVSTDPVDDPALDEEITQTDTEIDTLTSSIIKATHKYGQLRAQRAIVSSHHKAALRSKAQLDQMLSSLEEGEKQSSAELSNLRTGRDKLEQLQVDISREARQVSEGGSSVQINFNEATSSVGAGGTGGAAVLHSSMRR